MTARHLVLLLLLAVGAAAQRPNVVVVMTDDQGYGDFGYMGNPVIRTPSLDALAARSTRLESFYVCAVCAPTRASLMTGRWHMRTRAIDTYIGRAMMDPDETTIAEVLSDAGYATGIFGKWHLGDCHPMRPQDQGFESVLVHRGGGIGQPSDPPGGEGKYTDAILFENGRKVQTKGYCTDVYFDAAMDFIDRSQSSGRPFFCYIPTNAPHGPFGDVPEELYRECLRADLDRVLPEGLKGERLEKERDRLARIYAMNTNVDQNVGRLMAHLDRRNLLNDTYVVFLTDNGANGNRFNAGLRGRKGDVYEGGIRTPLIISGPGIGVGVMTTPSAHIDLMPTLLEACHVPLPRGLGIDGRSLLPALQGDASLPDRPIVIQAHRGDVPVRGRHCAIRLGQWKLVRPSGFGGEGRGRQVPWELYDLEADPGESRNLFAEKRGVARRLRSTYDEWFDDVTTTRPLDRGPPLIRVGTSHEPSVVLTRQDWRHSKGRPWARGSQGVWHLEVAAGMRFRVIVRLRNVGADGRVRLQFGDQRLEKPVTRGAREVVFEDVPAHQGPADLRASFMTGGRARGAYAVVVERMEP